MKICCAAFAALNHQSVLAVMGLWVAVAGGFVTLVWFLKPKIY
jgi:Flp pilus assembly protein protease CpaA